MGLGQFIKGIFLSDFRSLLEYVHIFLCIYIIRTLSICTHSFISDLDMYVQKVPQNPQLRSQNLNMMLL